MDGEGGTGALANLKCDHCRPMNVVDKLYNVEQLMPDLLTCPRNFVVLISVLRNERRMNEERYHKDEQPNKHR